MIDRATARLKRFLPRSELSRNVGVLVGGTAMAQAVPLLATPLLTRLYTPGDFGVLAVFSSILGLVVVVASLRYELAVPLPEKDEDAASILNLSLLAVVISSAVTAVVVWAWGREISGALGSPELSAYLWLMPVAVFLAASNNVLRYWAVRARAFGVAARTRIQQSVVLVFLQVVGFKWGSLSLVVAQTTSQGVGTLALARLPARRVAMRWRWVEIKRVAIRYRRFPFFSTWEGLFNTAGLLLPPLLFAALFGPAVAGLYALSFRVLSVPMSLIGSAIGQVFMAHAPEAQRSGQLRQLVARLVGQLARVGLAPALLLMLIGPQVFEFVFGTEWRQAGEFASLMTPWLYLVFIVSPVSTLFAVLEKQSQGLLFQAILLATRVGAILVGARFGGVETTVILFAGVSALTWAGFVVWVARVSGNTPGALFKPIFAELPRAALVVMPTAVALGISKFTVQVWLLGFAVSGLLIIWRSYTLVRTR